MDQTMHSAEAVLKLYKIKQDVNDYYDTYDSAIVAAFSEEEARNIHPAEDWGSQHTWADPEEVTVTYIGIAATDLEKGVVLSSFNAG